MSESEHPRFPRSPQKGYVSLFGSHRFGLWHSRTVDVVFANQTRTVLRPIPHQSRPHPTRDAQRFLGSVQKVANVPKAVAPAAKAEISAVEKATV
jgi:hypothetical protein